MKRQPSVLAVLLTLGLVGCSGEGTPKGESGKKGTSVPTNSEPASTKLADEAHSPGNPPGILIASEIDNDGNLVLVSYHTDFALPPNPNLPGTAVNTRILEKVPLKGVKIYDVAGKEVTVEAARKLLGKDTPVLASSWGRPLPPFYRKVFRDEMLLFAFPKEAPSWKEIQEPDHPAR
jgi:hypothetical protein